MDVIQVGGDEVRILPDHVQIHARHPIADWSVRDFCRHPIYFSGQKYYLRQRRAAMPPRAACYELVPWPADLHEESPVSFTYDEEFVARRDIEFRTEKQRTVLWHVLLPLYPFLGLCWSGFKEKRL